MKDMANVYADMLTKELVALRSVYMKRSTSDLNRLRSQKYNRLVVLERKNFLSYHDMLEIRTLKFHIANIDAVLAWRRDQAELL